MTALLDRARKRSAAMIETLGIDIDEALMRGAMTPDEVPEIASRCACCKESAACAQWLAAHHDSDVRAPEYCRNAKLFEALAI